MRAERILEGRFREAAEDLGKGLVFIEDERGDEDESDDVARGYAATVITAPPYEWPTSRTGPSISFTTLAM